MKNKVLVELIIPEIDEIYNVYLPVNRRIGNTIVLVEKVLTELTNGVYQTNPNAKLYNTITGQRYDVDELIRNTDIRNGTSVVLL